MVEKINIKCYVALKFCFSRHEKYIIYFKTILRDIKLIFNEKLNFNPYNLIKSYIIRLSGILLKLSINHHIRKRANISFNCYQLKK